MHSQIQQQLGYTLLLELLSYQFASPVRWIETQDVLLREQEIQRLVEIGPSDTLSAMMKKTLASQYQQSDAAVSRKRTVLSYARDAPKIHYDADATPKIKKRAEPTPTKPVTKTHKTKESTTPSPKDAVSMQVLTPQPPIAVQESAPVLELPDVQLLAQDIVIAIMAPKLKKPFGEIDKLKSIKQLTGGRSTLENEIVGDVSSEFASVPDRPEDMTIEELGKALTSSGFSGQLGKASTAIINRLFSLNMPAGFSLKRARTFLQERWGFQSGRQDAVLLRATTMQPSSRLASASEAESWLADIVTKYATELNLSLAAPSVIQVSGSSNGDGNKPAKVIMIDNEIAVVTKEKFAWRRAKLEALSKRMQIDLRAGDKAHLAVTKERDVLQKELDDLTTEFGEVLLSGVSNSFASTKARRYNSSWNWALQDLLEMYYGVQGGTLSPDDPDLLNRCILIAGRANPRFLRVLNQIDSVPSEAPRRQSSQAIILHLKDVCKQLSTSELVPYTSFTNIFSRAPKTIIDQNGNALYEEVPRSISDEIPTLRLKTKSQSQNWKNDEDLTLKYISLLNSGRKNGVSFQGKNVLVTGAGSNSIGGELLKGLLASGAKVIATTSSYSRKGLKAYQEIYMQFGADDSELVIVPFNQGSQRDLDALVDYIYDPVNGLGWDLDHIIPFAAISETGREVDGIDSKSELGHRIMLTNLLRLLGVVRKQKQQRECLCRPAQVILPLSPNHGAFGGDGMYAESKIALEALFDKWHSESWAPFLSICGASIGWGRGTGLMSGNDILAMGMEEHKVRTFSQAEMAFYILILMTKTIAIECDDQPVYADLTGGLDNVPDLPVLLNKIRLNINETKTIRRALMQEEAIERAEAGAVQKMPPQAELVKPQPNVQLVFPKLPDWDAEVEHLHQQLNGMVDLDTVVVVTGFGELGPCGNSRTRWEMEAYGTFSIEGCIEMAWIMGLIKNFDGLLDGKEYHGWVDVKTNKPIHTADAKKLYEAQMLENSGIRVAKHDGEKPDTLLQEVIVEEDLPPFSVPEELATQYEAEHGDHVDISAGDSDEERLVRFKKGAVLMLPKSLDSIRRVVGQIPQGWDPRTYGVQEDIISQVDPITLYTLITTVEALLASGITDPFELYKYVHVSEIGNCLGSGFGGASSLKQMYRTRHFDQPVQSDILAESFINTTPAWVNMLLLSASGPIRTAVGACATSIESLETGIETIRTGKAKMCLVGGVDDLDVTVSSEFANMKATVDAEKEFQKGRVAAEMSRPTASTRSGFVESQGAGVQVITSAALALEMGLPIHGIIALASTASDTIGRSVPAPGRGVLTNAAEKSSKFPSPLLNIQYRRRQLQVREEQIHKSKELELDIIDQELSAIKEHSSESAPEIERLEGRKSYICQEAQRLSKSALSVFGNEFWKNDASIAPIRGALAVWGLSINDVNFVSMHGTSTKLNDINEAQVVQRQLSHLGREPGNVALAICQKYLTGHSKGAAGAWMLNGALQVLDSGLVPGNRNADNIDVELAENDHLVFPNRSIQTTTGLKAFSLTSFGFGQKGAQAIGVHPKYLFAAISKSQFLQYKEKLWQRKRKANAFFKRAMPTNTLFVAKDRGPYRPEQLSQVLLNPEARAVEPEEGDELYYEDELVDRLM
ncbi:3-oxoacyl-synthase [Amylocarpus encephaloides]|uniref:beta-ketoacyl-[acyl-carrier-protein] synthase I n=1 Tax=Amylocarpus encephaloides TaxID=45428 RepID=A0A9P7YR26_9HELO|nr:3-oxoacyl-synthase [Amylocarpus encephaloides]